MPSIPSYIPQIPINTTRQPDIYGVRPGDTALPDPLAALRGAFPVFPQLTQQLGSNIMSNLRGELTPGAMSAITNSLNARSVGGGVGGSPFSNNMIAMGLGREAMGRQDLGLQQALATLPVYSQTATLQPAIQADIQRWNNIIRSAPDPQARQQADLSLQNQITAEMVKSQQAQALRDSQMRQREIALAGRRGSGTTPAAFTGGGLIGGMPGGGGFGGGFSGGGFQASRLPSTPPAFNNQTYSGTRPDDQQVIGLGGQPVMGGPTGINFPQLPATNGQYNVNNILQSSGIDWQPYV